MVTRRHFHLCKRSHSLECDLLDLVVPEPTLGEALGSLRKMLLEPGCHSHCLLCTPFLDTRLAWHSQPEHGPALLWLRASTPS